MLDVTEFIYQTGGLYCAQVHVDGLPVVIGPLRGTAEQAQADIEPLRRGERLDGMLDACASILTVRHEEHLAVALLQAIATSASERQIVIVEVPGAGASSSKISRVRRELAGLAEDIVTALDLFVGQLDTGATWRVRVRRVS